MIDVQKFSLREYQAEISGFYLFYDISYDFSVIDLK